MSDSAVNPEHIIYEFDELYIMIFKLNIYIYMISGGGCSLIQISISIRYLYRIKMIDCYVKAENWYRIGLW